MTPSERQAQAKVPDFSVFTEGIDSCLALDGSPDEAAGDAGTCQFGA
jgi:hypothetical protein